MSPAKPRSRPAVLILVAAVYLGLSFLPFWAAWTHGPSHWLQYGGQNDVGQAVFFMAQAPGAIIHGVNPLANSWANWPYGANYMDNTAEPLLALLMAPITLAISPIFSLNLLFTLTVWANCFVCYLVVQHLTRNRLAAFIAGLLFGFSPMATGAATNHEHVLFDLLPPVMFLLLWRLCTGRGRPLWNGIALGVSMAVQLYVFTEPLVDCVVVAALGLPVAAVIYRRQLAQRLVPLLEGALAAVVTFQLLASYGLYIYIDGPAHINGAAHRGGLPTLSADLLSPVLPTFDQRYRLGIGARGARLVGTFAGSQFLPNLSENGAYVGIPLLVILILAAVWLWRRPLVRWAAGLAIVALIFSMGPRLHIDRHSTSIPLPFDIMARVPLLDGVLSGAIASRFAIIEWFFLALMLGIALSELYGRVQRPGWRHNRLSPSRSLAAGLAVVVVAVVGLFPLVPKWPYYEAPVPLPGLAVGSQLRSLPTGQVLLGYPFPTANTYLMVFQAEDKMRFRIVGGSLIQPKTKDENLGSFAPASTCQSILNGYFDLEELGGLALSSKVLANCAADMLGWKVQTVLWTKLGEYPEFAKAFFTVLLGQPTIGTTDSALWLNPQPALRAVVADGGNAAAARARADGLG